MKKFAVVVVTCVIALSVIEIAQAQLLRRGSVSKLRGGNSGCCQYSCPTSNCQVASWCQPTAGYQSRCCEAVPTCNPCYQAGIGQNQSRYWSVCCCPQATYTNAVDNREPLRVTPYQACCAACTQYCPGNYNACIAYCNCIHGGRPPCNKPSCLP